MKVKIIHRGRVVEIADFDQLVVEDSAGNPVAVAGKFGTDETYLVSSIDDDVRFNESLRLLGINKTVIVTDLKKSLRSPEFLPTVV